MFQMATCIRRDASVRIHDGLVYLGSRRHGVPDDTLRQNAMDDGKSLSDLRQMGVTVQCYRITAKVLNGE